MSVLCSPPAISTENNLWAQSNWFFGVTVLLRVSSVDKGKSFLLFQIFSLKHPIIMYFEFRCVFRGKAYCNFLITCILLIVIKKKFSWLKALAIYFCFPFITLSILLLRLMSIPMVSSPLSMLSDLWLMELCCMAYGLFRGWEFEEEASQACHQNLGHGSYWWCSTLLPTQPCSPLWPQQLLPCADPMQICLGGARWVWHFWPMNYKLSDSFQLPKYFQATLVLSEVLFPLLLKTYVTALEGSWYKCNAFSQVWKDKWGKDSLHSYAILISTTTWLPHNLKFYPEDVISAFGC